MGKVLQAVVYVILILSIVAFIFANALFGKRELLQKRNSALEEQIVNLAKTIESKDAEEVTAPEVSKDISEVSDRELANPEKQNVLEDYPVKLETANLPTLDFGSAAKRIQLRSFYALNEDGTYKLSPVDSRPDSKGKGTMSELLGQLLDRAKVQQANLNKTRSELTKMREQFASSVGEVNKLKVDGRASKKELKASQEQVATLTTEKEALDAKVVQLNKEKKELNAELADQKDQVEKLNEEKMTIQEDLANAQKALKEMQDKFKGRSEPKATVAQEGAVAVTALSAGDKGKIIVANDDLKFCIIEFTPETMVEMLGAEREKPLPQLEMNIRRKGLTSATGDFVTRIKLRQAVSGKNLVVADILNDWQQTPVEKGDVVFF